MMIRLSLIALLCSVTLSAKTLHIQWDKTYGADKEDKAYDVVALKDGTIAMAGATRSFSLGKEDIYVLKTDAKGKMLWEKRLGKARKDIAYAIDDAPGKALYIAGTSKSYSKEGDYDMIVMKLDSNGNVLWGKSLGGAGKDQGYGVVTTRDGGCVVVGKTKSFGHGHYDAYVVKLSSDGKVLWSKAFGGESNDEAQAVTQLADGSLIITGGTESFGAGEFDFYIIKLAANGKKLWERYYGEKKEDMLNCVTPSAKGGFTAAGYTRSYHSHKKDLNVMRCDKDGNILWHKIVGKQNHEIANDIVSMPDDGVLVVGSDKSKGHGKNDIYVLTFDAGGKLTFEKTYGGKKNDVAHGVDRTPDGGYVIAGESESFGEEDYDVYLMKLK
jgi:uncharacterized delta-60 repeat protein